MSHPTKKMSPKKGYMEIGGYFYLGTHIKCAGLVTFILLRHELYAVLLLNSKINKIKLR